MWELVHHESDDGAPGSMVGECPCGFLRMMPKSSGPPEPVLFIGVFTCTFCQRQVRISARRFLMPCGEVQK